VAALTDQRKHGCGLRRFSQIVQQQPPRFVVENTQRVQHKLERRLECQSRSEAEDTDYISIQVEGRVDEKLLYVVLSRFQFPQEKRGLQSKSVTPRNIEVVQCNEMQLAHYKETFAQPLLTRSYELFDPCMGLLTKS
jgi:hypothetical protein